MKKLFVAAALALALTLASQQRASAWKEFNFSCGVSMCWRGGDNSYFWGMKQSGPWPGTVSGLPSYARVPTYAAPCYGGFDYAPAAPVAPHWDAPAPGHAKAYPPAVAPSYYSGFQPVNYYDGSYYQPMTWYGR
jgi:hypothetical protein